MNTRSPPMLAVPTTNTPPRDGWLVRLGRRLLLAKLARLEHGELRIREAGGEYVFGRRSAECDRGCTLTIDEARL